MKQKTKCKNYNPTCEPLNNRFCKNICEDFMTSEKTRTCKKCSKLLFPFKMGYSKEDINSPYCELCGVKK